MTSLIMVVDGTLSVDQFLFVTELTDGTLSVDQNFWIAVIDGTLSVDHFFQQWLLMVLLLTSLIADFFQQ